MKTNFMEQSVILCTFQSTFALSYPCNTTRSVTPVLAENFPDPAVVETGGSWFAFSTSGNGKNIQAAVSPDFRKHDWRLLGDIEVLPDPGVWAVNDHNVWAPDVIQLDDSRWVIYYAAPSKVDPDKHCIGAATSNSVLGPYEPNDEPLVCPLDKGGAIDPAGFRDPVTGNLYIIYKVDGNSLNTGGGPCRGGGDPRDFHPTPILVQQVANADGFTPVDEPFQILDRDENDGPLVEAPSMFYNNEYGIYFLTFSSNCYSTEYYDISFATSKDIRGPFCKGPSPLMSTAGGPVSAPGGADMIGNGTFALFHGTVGKDEKGEPIRYLFAAESEQVGGDMSTWLLV